ncbi:MAG: glycosyltransferase [bacterium]
MEDEKVRVTFIVVSGGHAVQALTLAQRMKPHAVNSFIVMKGDEIFRKRIPAGHEIHEITHTFQAVKRYSRTYLLLRTWRVLPAMIESLVALYKCKSDIVVSTGSGPALIPMFAAKLMRKKVVYVESVSRVHSVSLCGKVAHKWLADLFFVQWPEAKANYPNATYAGRLL